MPYSQPANSQPASARSFVFRCGRLVLTIVLVALLGTPPAHAQDEEATTRSGRINIQPGAEEDRPRGPADLEMQVQFTEPSGNNMIDAQETGQILVSLTNRGRGEAQDMDIWTAPEESLPEGLAIGQTDNNQTASSPPPTVGAQPVGNLSSLSPSDSATVKVPLVADRTIPDGEFVVTVYATESNGFGPQSEYKVRFPTRAFRPPELALANHAVTGSGMEDGEIEPSEIIDVEMRIQNEGLGKAEEVSVQVDKGSQNVYFTANNKEEFEIGTLQASEKEDISAQVYANNRAKGIPLILQIEEKRREFATTDTLQLDLETPKQNLRTVVAEAERAENETSPDAEYDELGIDVEQNIPETSVEKEKGVAVVLGIQQYPSSEVPDVRYASRDAAFIRKYLKEVLGYPEENILPRDPESRVTTSQLKTLFQQRLPSYVRDSSEVFVYFSGHGAPGPKGENAYLVGSDVDPNYVSQANAYRLDRFRKDLLQMAEKNNLSSLTVALDACFSGQSRSGDRLIRQASPLTLSVENSLLLQENATVFTAGTARQVANWYPDKKHGMFTYFFLKGLKGKADLDGDQEVTVQEMERYLTNENDGVPYWSRRIHQRGQVPQVVSQNPNRVLVQREEGESED